MEVMQPIIIIIIIAHGNAPYKMLHKFKCACCNGSNQALIFQCIFLYIPVKLHYYSSSLSVM